MSNQYKTGVVTTLEQVFLSREFERARDRQALLHDRTQGTGLQELEQVLLSDHCGGQRDRSPHVTQVAETPPAEVWSDNAVSTVLPSGLRENNRHRAIAAVSGIAAAALVVAGLASGGAQQRRGTCRLKARAPAPICWQGAVSGSPAGLSPGPADAGGTLAAVGLERAVAHVLRSTGPGWAERTPTRRDGRGSSRDDRHVGPIAHSARIARIAAERAHGLRDGRCHGLDVSDASGGSGAPWCDGTGCRRGRQHGDNGGHCCHHCHQPSRQRCPGRRARDRCAPRRNDRRSRWRRSDRHRSHTRSQCNNGMTTRDDGCVVVSCWPPTTA